MIKYSAANMRRARGSVVQVVCDSADSLLMMVALKFSGLAQKIIKLTAWIMLMDSEEVD